jgi:hypothetical protein
LNNRETVAKAAERIHVWLDEIIAAKLAANSWGEVTCILSFDGRRGLTDIELLDRTKLKPGDFAH